MPPSSMQLTLCTFLACLATLPAVGASLPATTRTVVYQKADAGYRLAVVEAPVPRPAAHQVLVHVRAVSLNRGEVENLAAQGRDRSGMIAASDAAGEIVALGPQARQFTVGQRVTSMYFRDYDAYPPTPDNVRDAIGSNMNGVFGDYIAIDESALVPIPAGWSDVEAATLPTAGLTAWSAVMVEGKAAPGKFVLVQGTGGVSTFALQIAHAAGAKVIVTSSSDQKLARARELGADFTLNYKTTPEWGKPVLELTGGHGADVVVEVGGKGTIVQSMAALAFGGTIAIIGGITGYGGELPTVDVLDKGAHVVGTLVGSRRQLRDLEAFLARHRVKPVIDRVYPLAGLDAAIAQLASGQFMGKIVVTL